MKWFWNYLRRRLQDDDSSPEPLVSRKNSVRVREDFEGDEGLSMQVHKAIGGKIVSFNHYDRKTDRSYRKVYIIQEDADFERELSKIITMESMRS